MTTAITITVTLLYAIGVGTFIWGLINNFDALNISSFEEYEKVRNFGAKCIAIGLAFVAIATLLNHFV